MSWWSTLRPWALGAVAGISLAAAATGAQAQEKKFKIYLSLSYSGNAWQS
ncbi:MAG: hypothetical protein JO157_14730, partial [Acetobacteraceae bacterium]|nr:hypothetical protein [Acetobacteraceae bacterium]